MAPARIPQVTEMLKELVALPSVSSTDERFDQPNRAVVDRLAEWAEAIGFRADVQPTPYDERKASLVATLGPQGDDGLVLAGHTDTVPWDAEGWTHDPFELTEQDGRLYGLGAADMKGALCAMLHAARRLSEDPDALRRPLLFVATADEESTMGGARALAESGGPKARAAVVGEPTRLEPIRKHKGTMMEAIRLVGRSGHSSDPSLGVSALEGMRHVLAEVVAFRADLQKRFRDEDFEVPCPTLNLGRIFGGDSPNRICAQCELRIDVRPVPGLSPEAVREELRRRIHERMAGSELDVEIRTLFEGIPPFETPAKAEIVKAAVELTGAPDRAVMFGTESPFFQQLGMDPIVLGPGDIAVAHQPDEYVGIEELSRAVDIYHGLARRFCVESS